LLLYKAIAVANESSSNAVSVALARAVGHAVATAHMADHSLRAADYALKAIKGPENQLRKKANGRMNICH
jgi:hypothetical protein